MHNLLLAQAAIRREQLQPAFFAAPLLTSIVHEHGGGAPSFTRASPSSIVDYEGKNRQLLSGEVGFSGARRVANLVGANSSFETWSAGKPTGWTVAANTSTTQVTGWDGTGSACQYASTLGGNVGTNRLTVTGAAAVTISGHVYAVSVRARRAPTSPTSTGALQLAIDGTNTFVLVPASAGAVWVRYATTFAATSAALPALFEQTANEIWEIDDIQIEDVTGQSNQNPSEYVSVGVLSFPYQGAGVDGVEYFSWYNGNTVNTNNVMTEARGPDIGLYANQSAYVPGVVNSYFSTPDSAAASITGDLDIRVDLTAPTYAPASVGAILGKWNDTGTQDSFLLRLNTGGGATLNWFDGTNNRAVNSTAAVNTLIPNGTRGVLRATLQVNDGAGGHAVTFYAGPTVNGPWTQLGNVLNAGAFTTNILDATSSVTVGPYNNGGSSPFVMTVYRVQIYNGINGTLAVDFNPNDYASGNTWSSGQTGETWTVNGGASILNFPLDGYQEFQASSNIVLQSENFGTTWTAVGTPTRSVAALRCGDVVLDLLGDDDAASVEGYTQPIVFVGDAVKAVSIFFAQNTSTSSGFDIRDVTAGLTRAFGIITWSAGVPTVTMNSGTLLAVDALANGVYRARVQTTAVTAANTNQIRVWPANNAAGTVSLTGAIYFGGVQVENATLCGPYVKTTTATITRAQDTLTYNTFAAGGFFANGVSIYADVKLSETTANGNCYAATLQKGNTNPTIGLRKNATPSLALLARDAAGGVHDAGSAGGLTAGTLIKWGGSVTPAGAVTEFVNGASVAPAGSGMTNLDQITDLNVGFGYGTGCLNGNVRFLRVIALNDPDAVAARRTA